MYRVEVMIRAAQRACRPRSFASCQVRPRQATCPAARDAPVHAAHIQCARSAHAVRMCSAHAMQCSSRGAPSSATVDAGMPKPRRKVSQKVVYTMARSKVSEERERSFLRPWSALGVGVGVGPGQGQG